MRDDVLGFDNLHAVTDGFFVHWDEMMISWGKGLVQPFYYIISAEDGAHLDETSQ